MELRVDRTSHLTTEQRRALLADIATGYKTMTQLARDHNVSRQTVYEARLTLLDQNGEFTYKAAKEALRLDSYVAVSAGVSLESDERDIKRGQLAKDILKGTGDLTAETSVQVTLQTALAAIPPDWHDRYILTPSTADTPEALLTDGSNSLVKTPADTGNNEA